MLNGKLSNCFFFNTKLARNKRQLKCNTTYIENCSKDDVMLRILYFGFFWDYL